MEKTSRNLSHFYNFSSSHDPDSLEHLQQNHYTSPMADSPGSLPLKITIKVILTIALVWAMATYLDQYFALTGGWRAIIIVGALLTLLNLLVRPILAILTLPLKFFAGMLAVIVVNGAFIWLVHLLVLKMDPAIVGLEIFGGVWGWIVVASAIGFANWVMKEIIR